MGTKTQFLLRDFYEVRRPEIHSTLRREEMSRIMGQTNKDFKSRNCIFDKFPSPQNVFVLESKVQVRSLLLFKVPYRSNVVDQRSRDG